MRITIIGGGAAGMMAGASVSYTNPSAEVLIVESNAKLGRKVVISGGGRCNLTTGTTDISELMKNYPRGNKWLKFAMYKFGPQDCYDFFESHGINLKIEGNRVFPRSNNGEDIVNMFLGVFRRNKVKILYKKVVQSVEKTRDEFIITLGDDSLIKSDKVILATGGSAYSKTGSRGDGYKFAKSFGHTVTQTVPTLTSFISNDPFIKKLAGVSIESAKIKLIVQEKYEFLGSFIFTHKGVSGPAIFALSSFSAYENLTNKAKLNIDFVPNLNYEQLRNKLAKQPNNYFVREVSRFVTRSLAEVFLIDRTKKVNEVGKKEFTRVIENLKKFKISIEGRMSGKEIVTAGGVSLKEVDKKTMQSLIVPGLYFVGELLDVDGLTGGYNLQSAWATGKLAGGSLKT